ncbi:MAG: tetrapyrrole methylase [Clostridia bacterium]|nr:tetrapyrrole methylase [Clostridia bacterium]
MAQIDELKAVIKRLRAKDGCPWDREQTHASLKKDIVEEAAEVICGINVYEETGNAESMMDELGDLLLQVVMQAEIADEEGLFNFEDVAKNVKEKMIRRHPHVFGDVNAETSEQVLKNWAEIKKVEKTGKMWMDEKIPEAFDEAMELLKVTKAKKLEKLAKTKEENNA